MAAGVPYQVRLDQYLADSNELVNRSRQVSLELQDHWRRGTHLLYEGSPILTRIDFLADIPMKIVDLVSSVVKTIFGIVYWVAGCGYNKIANRALNIHAARVALIPVQICLLFYAVIGPESAIDKYSNFVIRNRNYV